MFGLCPNRQRLLSTRNSTVEFFPKTTLLENLPESVHRSFVYISKIFFREGQIEISQLKQTHIPPEVAR